MLIPRVIANGNDGTRIVVVGKDKTNGLAICQVVFPDGGVSPPRYVDSVVRQTNGYAAWTRTLRPFNSKKEQLYKIDGYDEAAANIVDSMRAGVKKLLI